MKKLLLFLLAVCLVGVSLCGCGNLSVEIAPPEESSQREPKTETGGPAEAVSPSPALTLPDYGSPDEKTRIETALSLVSASGLLQTTFSGEDDSQLGELRDEAGNVIGGYALWYAFEDTMGIDNMKKVLEAYSHDGGFTADIPGKLVEEWLGQFFQIPAERMRELMEKFYDPQAQVYHYAQGRGGVPAEPVCTGWWEIGDGVYEVDFLLAGDVSDPDLRHYYSGVLTLQLTDSAWIYLACRPADV